MAKNQRSTVREKWQKIKSPWSKKNGKNQKSVSEKRQKLKDPQSEKKGKK